ncbi:MAG: extracellular solute-binding protein [Acidimicrobiales bacterium]
MIKSFEKAHPGVKVVNTSMGLSEQVDKLPLALATSSSTPTITQVNEGYNSMGRLVTDGELLPLNSLVKENGWLSKVGQAALQNNTFSRNGVSFGSGNIYAIPWTASEMGVYYNTKLLKAVGGNPPTSWAQFTHDLALLHGAGKVAIAYGGGQPSDYDPVNVFNVIANEFVPASQGIAWVYHTGSNPSIAGPGYVKAAAAMAGWARSGYFSPGYPGLSSSTALSQFTSGKAGFLIEGDWYASSMSALHGNVGFWVPTVVTGGPGEGWAIPTRTNSQALAVDWINLLLSPAVQKTQLAQEDIPIVKPSAATLATSSPLLQQAATGWYKAVSENNVVPYLADAPPSSFLNTQMSGIQELLAGQISPKALVSSWQSGYQSYWSSHS